MNKMQKVKISTECVCDISSDILKKFEIPNMYYYIQTQEGRFRDGEEISSDNLNDYVNTQAKEAISIPPEEEDYRNFFKKEYKKDCALLHICMAKNSSNGYINAQIAAKEFDNIYIFDSGHLSGGMGIITLCAAQMAKKGNSLEEILKKLEELRECVSSSFVVQHTERMYRNGKIDKNVNKICKYFSIHPLLTMKNSKIKIHGFYLGNMESYYKKYIRQLLKNKSIDTRIMFVNYAGISVEMQNKILEEIAKYNKIDKVIMQQSSATISSNCGFGTFGLCFIQKKAY